MASWRPETDQPVAWLQGQGALESSMLERLVCNSTVSMVVSQHGQPITVTFPKRYATPAQVRALMALHGHCQHPGCGHTRHLEVHHVVPHEHGGPTALWDLVLLCDEHHTNIHKPGVRSALTNDHTLLVWRSDGSLVNTGALRPAKYRKSETPTTDDNGDGDDDGDREPRLRGTGERMSPYALDNFLHAWLEHTQPTTTAA
jgi:hypothetical protein